MPARERWSRENPGTRRGLHCTEWQGGGVGGEGEGRGFSYLLESHMTYLAGSHVLKSWPGIRLRIDLSWIRIELKIFLTNSILLVYMHGPKILPMPKK
jgi:hypothetical protein